MLTKKRMARLTIFMVVAYFILLAFFFGSVVRIQVDSILLFVAKIGFLSISAAFTTAIVLILILKKDFVCGQFSSFNRYKYLLKFMVKRDFVMRYRRSVLGVLWSMLNPLLTMLVMTMVFSLLFSRVQYFPVYLISGLIVFRFFSETTTQAMNSVISGAGIIKKVYVPKYIFPLAKAGSSLVDLFFSFLAFLVVFIAIRVPFQITMFLLPIPILYTFVFSFGVGMMLSAMAVFFRDMKYLYGILTTLLMYMTPLFYPIDIIPRHFMPIISANPIYHFVDYFRSLALRGVVPGVWENAVCLGFALAALCFGVYVFMSKQDKFILYL